MNRVISTLRSKVMFSAQWLLERVTRSHSEESVLSTKSLLVALQEVMGEPKFSLLCI